jgi:hypothetical protein
MTGIPYNSRSMLPFPLLHIALAAFCAVALVPNVRAVAGEFQPLFNGRDLTGWDGDRRFWSVSGGAIRGETTLDRMPIGNTFLIWRGGMLRDFELKLKVRIRNGNSGVQYRSQDRGKFVVAGYQAEVDNTPGKAGFLYDEKGRKQLALVGEKVVIDGAQSPKVIGQLAPTPDLVAKGYYKAKVWNDYRIVARGNHLAHFINGVQVVDVIDNDPKGRHLEGVLALQIHVGPPMLVEFKDLLLKNLSGTPIKTIP